MTAAAEGHVADLIAAYVFARTTLETMKDEIKPYQRDADKAEADLFDFLESQNLRSVRDATRGLFTISDIAEPRVVDAASLVTWAEDAMPEILTANRSRLGAIIREILRGDRPMVNGTPEGLPPGVEATFRRSINWRRSP